MSLFIDAVNNSKLYGSNFATSGMVNLRCKVYKIYSTSKLVNKKIFSIQNPCYHANTCSGKCFNKHKGFRWNNGCSMRITFLIKWHILIFNYKNVCDVEKRLFKTHKNFVNYYHTTYEWWYTLIYNYYVSS